MEGVGPCVDGHGRGDHMRVRDEQQGVGVGISIGVGIGVDARAAGCIGAKARARARAIDDCWRYYSRWNSWCDPRKVAPLTVLCNVGVSIAIYLTY